MSFDDEYLRSPGRGQLGRQPKESSPPPSAQSSFLDRDFAFFPDEAPPVPVDSDGIDTGSIGGNGLSPPLPTVDAGHPFEPPLISDSAGRALRRLVNRVVPRDELPSVVEIIVSSVKAANVAECLEEGEAQPFIDAMDEARHRVMPSPRNCFTDLFTSIHQALTILDLAPRIRRKCVKLLYKTCAGHTSLPTSLRFELPEGPMGTALGRGGYADVFKCQQSCGREIAVKVLRARTNSALQRMVDVGHCTTASLHVMAKHSSHL